ncbi:microcystin degradation protein MlrC [Haloactinopolyspora alba]|uniref:Microcystin degradation protein MlrC n=1 Tax=Haloactinopolyspora alba TaxID=648780 RepID=A0A2P8DYB5_9ACTN|nr:M81 family metallopeptidase [Haloactinopolyspora alba]PSL02201.1 microcystin degradation protein MlrC [Haloactinopolyspora alba]
MNRPRIGIAGIAIESSTFSPHRSGAEAFRVTREDALIGRYDFLAPGAALRERADWVPLLHAVALPGGAVEAQVYDALRDEIVERIVSAGELDGLFLDIHGAMSVVGREDAEADLARAVREATGADTLISASMDLHGNVSEPFVRRLDLVTCYRMAPHEDAWESRERAAANLVDRLDHGGGQPLKAWVQVPVLLPGEKTSTRIEPARGIYARVPEVEAMPGVLDAAVWVGYAWADEPRCQAAVVVTGDDADVITEQAESLARSYWEHRADFAFVAPADTLETCVAKALASATAPYVISDSGDNPTAGGTGDVSWTLGRLLATPELVDGSRTSLFASIFDEAAVAACAAAGRGAVVTTEVGGRVDAGPSGPVTVSGTVVALTEDDPVAGRIAVLDCGGLHVIITERRKPYHLESDFTDLGLDPRSADIVVVKIGYLEPELYALAADWMLALTPGGVDQDLQRLGHHRIERPMYPFDPEMPAPNLTPRLV